MRKFTLGICLSLLTLMSAHTLHAETTRACAMDIPYNIQPAPPGTPPNIADFLGVWKGYWEPFNFPGSAVPVRDFQCSGLIVESVDAAGNASMLHFWGAVYRSKPGVSRYYGKIVGNKLTLPKGQSGLYEMTFTLKSPNQLASTTFYGYRPGLICRAPVECKPY